MKSSGLSVKDWMQSRLHTVHLDDTIEHARELCERHRVNQLPVVVRGELVGIVTDRDLRDAFPSIAEEAAHPAEARAATESLRVEEVMSPNVLTVSEADPIERAATLMRRERIGALPVVRDGRLVGIVTRSDLLAALVALLNPARDEAREARR
jgi:acetoin utilization protein AcuB